MTTDSLSLFRKAFPQNETNIIYLNHAAIGPMPYCAIEAIETHLLEKSVGVIDHFAKDFEVSERLRARCARLIHAEDKNDIIYIPNTGSGLNTIVQAMDWQEGDEILVNDLEFPSNVYPYLNLKSKGVKTIVCASEGGAITSENLLKAVTPKTRIIAISAVQFLSGYRAELETLGDFCSQNDIFLIVDGIQAAGICPIDVQTMHIDAFATGTHKWLCSTYGFGFMYVSKRLFAQMKNTPMGWLSVEQPWDLFNHDQNQVAGPRRMEVGVWNTPGIVALDACIELLLNTGIEQILAASIAFQQVLVEGLKGIADWKLYTPFGNSMSGILSFVPPNKWTAEQVVEKLKAKNIHCSSRDGKIRFSPHGYNTIAQAEAVVKELVQLDR